MLFLMLTRLPVAVPPPVLIAVLVPLVTRTLPLIILLSTFTDCPVTSPAPVAALRLLMIVRSPPMSELLTT